jgi:erythritol transport system ATP-binding protein
VTSLATSTPVLEARGVTKTYPGTKALSDVDFQLERGHVHALIGENGAGKSTLLKILAGIEQPTSGEVLLDGQPTQFTSARHASASGVSIIHQELALFPDLTVVENLFVGSEIRTRWGAIAWAKQEEKARQALARLGQSLSLRATVGELPLGQQQIVEIARALVHDMRVLLMDEPTSALTATEIPILFDVIRDLTRHGVSIVYVSHRLEELLEIADQITILRDGKVVGHALADTVNVPWIVQRMTGRDVARAGTGQPPVTGSVILAVNRLTLPAQPGRTGLNDISFELRSGEVLCLYGLMGAGRTELFESLLGVFPDTTGEVRLDDRELSELDVSDRVAAGLALVPEDRQAAGLVPSMTVCQNVTLSSLERLARFGYVSPSQEARAAQPWLESLRVKAPALDAPIGVLSGGNQQKAVIARGVMSRPRVLLLDEPTRGVDVAAKFEILESMRRLAAEGVGIVFATADLTEAQAVATRVLVLARGRITADLAGAEATADALASAASGTADPEGFRAGP